MNRPAVLAGATLLLVASTACGSSRSTSSPTPAVTTPVLAETSTTETPSLREAVYAYTAAYLGGNAETAYNLLSQRCRNTIARNEFIAIVQQAKAAYASATITAYSEAVDGNVATVSYELTDPVLNQTDQRWVREGDGWSDDHC